MNKKISEIKVEFETADAKKRRELYIQYEKDERDVYKRQLYGNPKIYQREKFVEYGYDF